MHLDHSVHPVTCNVLHQTTLFMLVYPTRFLMYSPVVFSFNHSDCHRVFQFLSLHHMAGKGCPTFLSLSILFFNEFLVFASHTTDSFDFFVICESRNIFLRNHISTASAFFYNVLNLSKPRIHTSG